MQYFYDAQIRKILVQLVRCFSGFKVSDINNKLTTVPVMMTGVNSQVASLIKSNSPENMLSSAPSIRLMIDSLKTDPKRYADPTFVEKKHIRERAEILDDNGNVIGYGGSQGSGYTIERVMPVPYTLGVKLSILCQNQMQKLELLEQILSIFYNQALELQTTDNFLDWSALTVIYLEDITYNSGRPVPVGTSDDLDTAEITLTVPFWLSLPGKVSKLSVIQSIYMNLMDESINPFFVQSVATVGNFNVLLENGVLTILNPNIAVQSLPEDSGTLYSQDGNQTWLTYFESVGGKFTAGSSQVFLKMETGLEIVGTLSFSDIEDDSRLLVNFDKDTLIGNTLLTSIHYPVGNGYIDAIINPQNVGRDAANKGFNPLAVIAGSRYLLIDDIGTTGFQIPVLIDNPDYGKIDKNGKLPTDRGYLIPKKLEKVDHIGNVIYETKLNNDSSDAWKNTDGSDFVALKDDIIEWSGNHWEVILRPSTETQDVYITNSRTGFQYMWSHMNQEWAKSIDRVYHAGEWRMVL